MATTNRLRYILYARKSTDEKNKQQLSIESQIEEMQTMAVRERLVVVKTFVEKMSAKKPGPRKEFYAMLESIEKGEANAILTWKLDRLSRNPVDSGRIQQMLDERQLLEVKCYDKTYHAEDNVLITYLEFGMSHEYRQRLSEDVKRGCRTKIQKGEIPGHVPVGYINKRVGDRSTVEIDPERFHILRKSWDRLLEYRFSLRELHRRAVEDGLRGRDGKPYCRSNFYKLFTNPFYYGYFTFKMEPGLHKGSHQPMVTKEEFDKAQEILSDTRKPQQVKRTLAFTNLLKCGACGSSITGYEKVKRQKNGKVHHYTYYCCTRTKDPKCRQPQITGPDLDAQIAKLVDEIALPESFHKVAVARLQKEYSKETEYRQELADSRRRALVNAKRMLDGLITMRAKGELDQAEYAERKKAVTEEMAALEQRIALDSRSEDMIAQRIGSILEVLTRAKQKLESGDFDVKRQLLLTIGLNLFLRDKTLDVAMNIPFKSLRSLAPLVRKHFARIEPGVPAKCERVMDKSITPCLQWWAVQDLNL